MQQKQEKQRKKKSEAADAGTEGEAGEGEGERDELDKRNSYFGASFLRRLEMWGWLKPRQDWRQYQGNCW